MYRVRLASGEETAFRSIEELALGIQSGVITVNAEIHDADNQRWLPIAEHPEYLTAAEQAASKGGLSFSGPVAAIPDADVEVLFQGKVPIYKMVSVSARELEARRRPRWISTATTGGAAVIFLGTIVVAFVLGGGGPDVAWRRPDTATQGKQTPAASVQANASGAPRAGIPVPAVLARSAATARAEAARVLGEAANHLGIKGLVSPPRLFFPDSLRVVRQAVANFRFAVGRWRDAEAEVVAAYRDTATTLAHSGRWGPSELSDWRAQVPAVAALSTVRTTDTLLLSLDRGYALLEESGPVDSSARPRLGQAGAAAEYDRIRTTILRLAAATGDREDPPLVILRSALGGMTFPAAMNR